MRLIKGLLVGRRLRGLSVLLLLLIRLLLVRSKRVEDWCTWLCWGRIDGKARVLRRGGST